MLHLVSIVLFAAGLLFATYVLIGWPILLSWRARYGVPIHKQDQLLPVSVVIAARNGEHYLKAKLESVLALAYPRELLQIIVVSDGSTDGTAALTHTFSSVGVQLIEIPPSGKCAALNAGIPHATGDVLLLTDVRQQIAPDSLRYLVSCFADPTVGVVSGDLIIRKADTHDAADVGVYWRFESWIRRQLSQLDSMFGATGPFYAIRRSLAIKIPEEILLDDMYLPISAFFRGYRLIVEDRAKAYDYPTSRETEFRRKVRTLAGNYQLLRHYPGLLGPQNRLWLHYVSYKLGRLLLPFALLLIFTASFGLPWPFAAIALSGQGLAYGLALADSIVPSNSPLKRLTSPLRTFVVMMAAALCAISVFFVPPQSLWKVTSAANPQSLTSTGRKP